MIGVTILTQTQAEYRNESHKETLLQKPNNNNKKGMNVKEVGVAESRFPPLWLIV